MVRLERKIVYTITPGNETACKGLGTLSACKKALFFWNRTTGACVGKTRHWARELRSRFTGLSLEQELQILELILLTCTLRLCKVEICCHFATLKKLSLHCQM
jgi:hypothetical protein